jgi:outer membrane receptor for ferrienterochelin and colicins
MIRLLLLFLFLSITQTISGQTNLRGSAKNQEPGGDEVAQLRRVSRFAGLSLLGDPTQLRYGTDLSATKMDFCQRSLVFIIRNQATNEPVVGARITVQGTDITSMSDQTGRVELTNVPAGEQTVEIFSPGYETKEIKLVLPLNNQSEQLVFLTVNNDVGEVTITSTTRISREIDDIPTRIEVISEEEVDEKANMRPANVSMVLNESTGIKVQQTSASSNTQSVRIQGLDGRYTQILKDGFPAFGGFSGSLSLLDIPPLDLKQVEIIKGPSAIFYGGGAIAGVINFVSKEPANTRQTLFLFNQTTALGTDVSLFDARKLKRFGYTFLGSLNYQHEYDVDDDDFTELPRVHSFGVTPRFFFGLNEKTRLIVGNSTAYQRRQGGDVFVIHGRGDNFHQYFETNNSVRNITTATFEHEFTNGRRLSIKQAIAVFRRELQLPGYTFKGHQFNWFSDLTYILPIEKNAFVFGFNTTHDRFREDRQSASLVPRDESITTVGAFVHDTIALNNQFSLEGGMRLDYLKGRGVFALPRVSLLYRANEHLSSRFSFGLGYEAPSIFTEDAEEVFFRNVLPIEEGIKAETSRGGTFDINYRNSLREKISYSLNQMFFYTMISDPLILTTNGNGTLSFRNAGESINSRGFETNARVVYEFVKLFAGYTFTDAKANYLIGNKTLPLVSKSRLNSSLVFEKEANFKAGLEAYYSSSQILSNGPKTKSFWTIGISGEKTVGKLSFFINAENITDTRQSRFGQVVFPPHQNPTFAEIYTHTEGRVINGGIKVRL